MFDDFICAACRQVKPMQEVHEDAQIRRTVFFNKYSFCKQCVEVEKQKEELQFNLAKSILLTDVTRFMSDELKAEFYKVMENERDLDTFAGQAIIFLLSKIANKQSKRKK